MEQVLQWLRHHRPRCPMVVVADHGAGEEELIARCGGAFFLTRPVSQAQWAALVAAAFAACGQTNRSNVDTKRVAGDSDVI